MIKLRLNAISSNELDVELKGESNIHELVKRLLSENGLDSEDEKILDTFCVIYNGHEIPREFWEFCAIEVNANILIAPVIKGGSFGEFFKLAVVLVVTAVVATYAPGLGFNAFQTALLAGAASIGTSLLLNSLIPPPTAGLDLGSAGDYASSQMFTISSQSNQIKKYGFVPKVYGTHRVYPNVAATPYAELQTDPSTGKLVQFFHAIYDFGYGPMTLSNFKIGDTALTRDNFSDVTFNLVDLNKPAVSEGPWDNVLQSNFTLYKGDVNSEDLSVGINKNSTDPTASPEDYTIIREAAQNIDNIGQEICINMVCPQGLYCYGTNGTRASRYIEMMVEFAKVGTENWHTFNDPAYVSSFVSSGGVDTVFVDTFLTEPTQAYGSLIARTEQRTEYNILNGNYDTVTYSDLYYPAGTTQLVVKATEVAVGDILKTGYTGELIGKVTAAVAIGSMPGWLYATIDRPLTTEIVAHVVNYTGYWFALAWPITRVKATNGRARIVGNDTTPVYATFKFSPKEIGSYKIRIRRDQTYSDYTYQTADTLTLYNITTRFNKAPIVTDKRHVFLEIKIRATDQLNGAIQNLSAIASSVLDVYDPDTETWSKQQTGNPAWVFADLLTSEVNKRAIPKSRLDVNSLVEWAEFCDEVPASPPGYTYTSPRFRTNFVLDYQTTLQGVLSSVSNAAQASLNIVDGKYGVLIDKIKTVPVQIFTPRNSSNFSSTRNYVTPPHALKIKYIEPNADWQQIERIVYSDGYNALNATEFDELDTFACTDPEQAWRFGRYMMAQNILRQEQISIDVDFEYLVCTRGDYVQVTQDVMLAGGLPARVKTVVGNVVTIDDGVATEVGVDYGYVYRNAYDGIKTSTLTVLSSNQFQLDGDIPSVGDLFIIGEVGQIVMDCLVKAIQPSDELTATLILVEKADGVYEAESSMTLPTYIPDLSQGVIDSDTPPGEVQALAVEANTWYFTGAGYQHYVDLDWDVPISGGIYEAFEIYVNKGNGYDLYTTTRNSEGRVLIDSASLGVEHSFKILAVSATGAKLDLGQVSAVTATPEPKTTRPSNVLDLYINITNEVLQLTWPAVTDVDVKEYLIRYSPNSETASWTASIPLLRTGNVNTLASAQARTGTYLIKALDWNSNESEEAAIAVTSIPNLFNLNFIAETEDFPDLEGTTDRVVAEDGTVILQNKVSGGVTTNEFYEEGFYYYKEFLDLGDIYTVRLQSLIEAEGYTLDDMMESWVTLSSVVALANSKFSEWDVETQVRATNQFNVMAEWPTLDVIDPISEGNQDLFTAWRTFTIGDFTGRIFQFRLRLISKKASVSPRVFDGTISADMPDRTDIYNNIISEAVGPTEVVYSTPFKGPGTSPNIQITQDAAESGDYYIITDKTLAGFNITFYDNTDTQVVRQFDTAVRGWGRRSSNTI